MYDVIIIGGGIAGLTSAIYTTRRELKTLIISLSPGGQMATTPDIENWPGEDNINGAELASNIQKQAQKFGAEIKFGMVKSVSKTGDAFEVFVEENEIKSKALILAYGKSPRKLGIKNEDKLEGKGISYCVNCDGQFFKGKDVAIVGGGNSALEAAITMSEIGDKVYLIHRRDEFRGEGVLINKVKRNKKVNLVLNDEISEIKGDEKLKSIKTKSGKLIDVDGLFIEVGYVADSTIVKDLVDINEANLIKVNSFQETSSPGVFAAGDITDQPYQQLVIASGQGAVAALSAVKYIQNLS